MTDRPIIFSAPMVRALLEGRKTMTRRLAWRAPGPNHHFPTPSLPSPWQRVAPGDRLWVRESFATTGGGPIRYAATDDIHELRKRRPSIHLPRWASRLTLTVTETKIERLQEITYRDCEAEGCTHIGRGIWNLPGTDWVEDEGYKMFRRLWESLHGAGSWDANPEVVALRFTVEQRNIDAKEAA